MDKNSILKRVIAKLEKTKEENLEKIASILEQQELKEIVLKIEKIDDPEEVKSLVIKFDYENNKEKEQLPRLELLNELKKNGIFKKFGQIGGMEEMWRRLVIQEWKISYKFES